MKKSIITTQCCIYIIDITLVFLISYALLKSMTKIVQTNSVTISAKPKEIANNPSSLSPLVGIDVSHYQGNIEWESVASDFHFSFVKATEGTAYIDPKMAENLQGLAKTSMQYGVYHFYLPDKDALKQAQHFLNTTRDFSFSLPPVLDIEVEPSGNKKTFVQGIKTWINAIEASTGCPPILYTNKSFWNDYLKEDFQNYPVWISDYTTHASSVANISWEFWQFTDSGKAKGVSGLVDKSHYQGSVESLSALGVCFI